MKSDKRERAGAERFLKSLESNPKWAVSWDVDRVLRRDRRKRREALNEAIDTLVPLISRSNDPFDFARNIGISKAIDAIRNLRNRQQ